MSVNTFDPSQHSDRMPLEIRVVRTPWYAKLFSQSAWRIYITILLVLNLIVTSAIIGSLQQVYKSVNTLTEFVAKAVMSPVKPAPIEPPKTQKEDKRHKKLIPQAFEFVTPSIVEKTPSPVPTTPTHENRNDLNRIRHPIEDTWI